MSGHETVFQECLQSMQARDGEEKDGVMDLNSCFCKSGSEITTYDSLDIGLGRACWNSYTAVKCFSAYLALEEMLTRFGRKEAEDAHLSAKLYCSTILQNFKEEGRFPALLDGEGDMVIIPIIEGLVYPYFFGRKDVISVNEPYKTLIEKLRTYMTSILWLEE